MSAEQDRRSLRDELDANLLRELRRLEKTTTNKGGKTDLRAVIEAPVRIKQDGATRSIDPYEAMLRQHVRRSLVDRCVASMKFLLTEAEKHKLIEEAPSALDGGIFIVPKNLPEELDRRIFEQQTSIAEMMRLLLPVTGIKRLMECFNGWRRKVK